jgi:hypothetical protein
MAPDSYFRQQPIAAARVVDSAGPQILLPLPLPASQLAMLITLAIRIHMKSRDNVDEALDAGPLLYADQGDNAKPNPSRTGMLFLQVSIISWLTRPLHSVN